MIHPMMIAPIFVAVLVILAIVFLSRGSPSDNNKEQEKEKEKTSAGSASAAAAAKKVAYREESTGDSSAAEGESSSAAAAAKSGRRKKRRSNKKKSTKAESEEDEEEEESPAAAVAPVVEKKAASKTTAAAAVVVAAVAQAPVTTQEESDSSSDEEEIVKPKKAAPKKAAKKSVADEIAPAPTVIATHFDGWNVVEDKKGKAKQQKKAEEAAAVEAASVAKTAAIAAAEVELSKRKVETVYVEDEPAAPVSPPAPVVELISHEMTVDSKKVGLLIGPKGVTKTSIQDATATTIQMPKASKETVGPVSIVVTGPELGVKKAVQALNELITKGYCSLLAPEDFQESYVAVHPKYLKDIIGKGGAVIKALGNHTGVKITIPDTVKAPSTDGKVTKVKIGLTGQKDKVSLARALIKDLTKYYHTTITHPGVVHAELDISTNYYNYIIGSKGSEIKNIQACHKVSVYIPDADSANPNVIVVGEPQNVIAAQNHIEQLIVRADEKAAANAANAAALAMPKPTPAYSAPPTIGGNTIGATVGGGPGWNNNTIRKPKAEEAEEDWVKEFAPNSSLSINITSILNENTKFAPVSAQPVVAAGVTMPALIEKTISPAPSSAWNNLSSAWNN